MKQRQPDPPVRRPRVRRGFALIAVLWIVAALSVLALGADLAARRAIATAQNRLSLARARWRAEACLEIARSAIQDVLDGQANWLSTPPTWMTLDSAVAAAPMILEANCQVELRASGVALDVNAASSADLRTLFRAAGLPPLSSDSLADAILDWRDTGNVARPLGANRVWYLQARRLPPRNGPFADMREVHLVRGYVEALARVPALDTLLTVVPGRIVIGRAPLPVLATLPGFNNEALARVLDMRARGVSEIDEQTLERVLSPATAKELGGPMMQQMRRVVAEPDLWIVMTHGWSGAAPEVEASIELSLVHAGSRAAIVRRRTWP